MTARTRTAAIVSLIVSSASTVVSGADADAQIILSINMAKPVLYAGEPAFVNIRFTNRGDEARKLNLGWNAEKGITFEVKNATGKRVAGGAIESRGGFAKSGKTSVPARATVERKYLLNKWVSTVLPSGDYTLVCTAKDVGSPSNGLSSESRLRIVPMNEKRLQQVFEQHPQKAANEEDYESMILLSYSRSPLVIPYLVRFLGDVENRSLQNMRRLAVEGLGRVGTVEAVEELVNLVREKDSPEDLDRAGRAAAIAVFEINDTATDPEVKKACKGVVDTMPRPLPLLRSP